MTKIKTNYLLVFIIWMCALIAYGQDTPTVPVYEHDTTTSIYDGEFLTQLYQIHPYDTLNIYQTHGRIEWKTSDDATILHTFEYDMHGIELTHTKSTIIHVSHEHNAITYNILDIDDNYVVSFWLDGTMVVYTFQNLYVIVSGNIGYH